MLVYHIISFALAFVVMLYLVYKNHKKIDFYDKMDVFMLSSLIVIGSIVWPITLILGLAYFSLNFVLKLANKKDEEGNNKLNETIS